MPKKKTAKARVAKRKSKAATVAKKKKKPVVKKRVAKKPVKKKPKTVVVAKAPKKSTASKLPKGVKVKDGQRIKDKYSDKLICVGKSMEITLDEPQQFLDSYNFTGVASIAFVGECHEFVLEHNMPDLRCLTIDGATPDKVVLNDKLTPRLQEFTICGNCNGETVTLDVESSTLQVFDVDYCDDQLDQAGVNRLVRHCPRLRLFVGYKSIVEGPLRFANPNCEFNVYRADG